MKNRTVVLPVSTRTQTFNKFTKVSTDVETRSLQIVDRLDVLSDHLGPVDKTVFHPHQFQRTRTAPYIGVTNLDSSGQTVQVSGYTNNFNNFTTPTSDYTNVLNKAVADVYEQLRSGDVGTGLNIAVDLAEGHQVKKMVNDAMALVKHILRFRKPSNWYRAFAESKNIVKSFSTDPRHWGNQWLAFQYGWWPLANTLYGSFNAVMHRRTYSLARIVGKGYDRQSTQKYFSDQVGYGSRELVQSDRRLRAMVTCEFELGNTIKQRMLGYTSLNPLVIAWELVPLSFVVDWVYDIGGYLEALEGAAGFGQSFKRGFYVTGQKWEQFGQLYGGGTQSGTTRSWDCKAYYHYTAKNRYVLVSYPLPRPPIFKVNLGSQRLFSAASLLGQFLGKPGALIKNTR